MSTNRRSTVVGVFRDRSMAEQAMEALTNAGFDRNQIRYSGSDGTNGSSGSLLGDIKSLFTGQNSPTGSFANDLADLGITDDEANYYSNEYSNGRSIIAVQAPGNEQEAMSVLNRYGAYNHYSGGTATSTPTAASTPAAVSTPAAAYAQQSPAYAQQNRAVPPTTNQPAQRREDQVQAPSSVARENAVRENQQSVDTVPLSQNQVAQHPQSSDQLQSMQTELQSIQKQIQEAQAQLKAAKDQEAQARVTREREVQLQSTQKQLQEAQAQLKATLEELHATQSRINQPNNY